MSSQSTPLRRRPSTNDDLAQSMRHLSLAAKPPAKPPTTRSPSAASMASVGGRAYRSPSVASSRGGGAASAMAQRSPLLGSGRESRAGAATPTLLRKASLNSLHGANGKTSSANLRASSCSPAPTQRRSPSGRSAGGRSPGGLSANGSSSSFFEPLPEEPTAEFIAQQHFEAELTRHAADLRQPLAAPGHTDTVVVLQDSCYGHRFARPRTSRAGLNTIVERPERLQACVVGVSAAYVRLGGRHAGGAHMPHPRRNGGAIASVPFHIRKTTRQLPLQSAAVTNVHGAKWMDELRLLCESAEAKLALNGKELQREGSSSSDTPEKLHEGDLYLCAESLDALQGALGGVCEAVDAVFGGSPPLTQDELGGLGLGLALPTENHNTGPKRAFVGIRPPGHHCSATWPSGFCWINNVHVGIMHAMLTHGLTHAAIVDFDLHHGDGSQAVAWQHNARGVESGQRGGSSSGSGSSSAAATWKKASIGYFSLHDINSFPCESGDGDKVKNASICLENAHGQNVWNVHLERWKTEAEFWRLYETKYVVLLDRVRAFLRGQTAQRTDDRAGGEPKAAIFISAGFDASEWETPGMQRHEVNVPTEFYARFTRDIVRLADEEGTSADGRVISVLEGGYSNRALISGVLSHLSGSHRGHDRAAGTTDRRTRGREPADDDVLIADDGVQGQGSNAARPAQRIRAGSHVRPGDVADVATTNTTATRGVVDGGHARAQQAVDSVGPVDDELYGRGADSRDAAAARRRRRGGTVDRSTDEDVTAGTTAGEAVWHRQRGGNDDTRSTQTAGATAQRGVRDGQQQQQQWRYSRVACPQDATGDGNGRDNDDRWKTGDVGRSEDDSNECHECYYRHQKKQHVGAQWPDDVHVFKPADERHAADQDQRGHDGTARGSRGSRKDQTRWRWCSYLLDHHGRVAPADAQHRGGQHDDGHKLTVAVSNATCRSAPVYGHVDDPVCAKAKPTMPFSSYNPFAYRDVRSHRELVSYRVLTLASWALAVALSIYYSVRSPHGHGSHRIADQNHRHLTGFTLNMVIVYVYWAGLFTSQAGYINRLFSSTASTSAVAAAVGSHFILNNLLHSAFVMLFVTGHFVLAEIVLAANFINLSTLSMRHPLASHPLALVHLPTVAGPLAWTFVALFWNGAIAVPHAHSLFARVTANIFVWSILGYGLLFILLGDISMGFLLSVLAAALGVGQFFIQFIALQWIFAFSIMATLFVATFAIAVPQWTGSGDNILAVVVNEDTERAPLLNDSPTPSTEWTASTAPPIRRFPFPSLHVGTDICDVTRIYALLDDGSCAGRAAPLSRGLPSQTRAARLVRRLLTAQELPPPQPRTGGLLPTLPSSSSSAGLLAWLLAGHVTSTSTSKSTDTKRPRDPTLWKAAQFLAGRFAAKEAAIKAHPHLSLTFHQIRIVRAKDTENNGSGPPVALIQLPPCAHTGTAPVEQEARLSISHDGTYATAVCIGFQDSLVDQQHSL
ncbi:histone deacetylase [Grosmannia clavigera kw1407]|uniref:Histone deacetylase n=1 Tax=Grosmannia clavigera (strain kw1407 / UAMH 11150) TaxID=655863 RepID=F0X8J8_GROCL|nr:histone deacetylase [Grosmannia clavigera kw1407]EFX05992.1 histone deacetylase [Grosmannia clavigera kw1407]